MLLAQNLDRFNVLKMESSKATQLSTPAGIINEALKYLFPLAGFVLFVMLVFGGFEMMTSTISGKKEAGRQRITAAIIGFVLLFVSYWIMQVLEVMLGIKVLA
jgi:hypothetical protein